MNSNVAQERIKYYSGVNIPEETQLVYNFIDSLFGNHGQGPQYTVFRFEEEPTAFFTSDFHYGGEWYYTNKNGEKLYTDVLSGTLNIIGERMPTEEEVEIDEILAWCNTPDKYLLNWDSEYTYYKDNLNIFVYFKESKILIYVYKGYLTISLLIGYG